jgi:ribonucleoside-diphosphate reductase alpha chain
MSKTMIGRRFTSPTTFTEEAWGPVHFAPRTVKSLGGSSAPGTVVAPTTWSQTAVDMLASKYARRAGVPLQTIPVLEVGVPAWLCRRVAKEGTAFGAETDFRQVFARIAGCWAYWGWRLGYFTGEAEARAFFDEARFGIAAQFFAPASPQWFNTGLYWAYGITGPGSGQHAIKLDWKKSGCPIAFQWDKGGAVKDAEWHGDGWKERGDKHGDPVEECGLSYIRPAAHACFILGVTDDLLEPGGIYDGITREARVFKFGGGAGGNFSRLRGEGEPLSGGGRSSGPLSFLRINDAGGGAIKSGGVTRRAAKMVIMDVDHPDIEAFVEWKATEEFRVAAMVAGSRMLCDVLPKVRNGEWDGEGAEYLPKGFAERVAWAATVDEEALYPPTPFTTHFEGKDSAYYAVGGQNANNSVRVTKAFMDAVDANADWNLIRRTDGGVAKTIKARDLWRNICRAAYTSADPGVQHHTTINDWNPVPESGEIRASNPCSEFNFLDDTACNLASLRLTRFLNPDGTFDLDAYRHFVRLLTVALDVTVSMAGYPSAEVAEGSRKFRSLGLGYADLGAFLMRKGIAYDSDAGRAWCAAVTSLMHSACTEASADLAGRLGAYPEFEKNKEHHLRVVSNHAAFAYRFADPTGPHTYWGLSVEPPSFDSKLVAREVVAAVDVWAGEAVAAFQEQGMRNAQLTLLAPTGTIGYVLDCDTFGIEPDFALVKDKKLVGGGYIKVANQSVGPALKALGYDSRAEAEILFHLFGSRRLPDELAEAKLTAVGLRPVDVHTVRCAVPSSSTLDEAFRAVHQSVWAELRPAESLAQDLDANGEWSPTLFVVRALTGADVGPARKIVAEMNRDTFGYGTVEGAPGLSGKDYPVFSCASVCGAGTQFLSAEAHVTMMAAAQPSLSGAISKTINLPATALPNDVDRVYRLALALGCKCIALYIDGSKFSQPLNAAVFGSIGTKFEAVALEAKKLEGVTGIPVEFEDVSVPIPIRADDRKANPPTPDPRRLKRGERERLPSRRAGETIEVKIGGQKFFFRTSVYPDGRCGEVFIDCVKEGGTLRATANALAIAVSLGLQYGVPLEKFVDTFAGMRFEPAGVVQGHERVKMASSFLDLMARELGITFLGRDELAHVQLAPPPDGDDGPADDEGRTANSWTARRSG